MKAWVLHNIDDLKYEDVDNPSLQDGWSLIRVGAAGICGSDIPRIFQTGAHKHPLIPGHEFAGTVAETSDTSGRIHKNQPVGVFPLIPCGKCKPCQSKHYEMCRNYNYLGSRSDGGFAEYCLVPNWNLLPLPEGITMEQAAMLEPMSVAMHAIRQLDYGHTIPMIIEGEVQMGEPGGPSVLIIGLGTIGLFAAMHLIALGYQNVHVIGNKDYQLQQFIQIGGKPENYHDGLHLPEVEAFDMVIECVGKPDTIRQAIRMTAPGKSIVLVGNPSENIGFPKDVYWKILRNQLRISGTWNSSYLGGKTALDDWNLVLRLLARGQIHPERLISQRLSLEHLMDGLCIMRDKTENYTKVMVVNN